MRDSVDVKKGIRNIVKKYSIDEYLEILSKMADKIIIDEINKTEDYAGGKCIFKFEEQENIPRENISVMVELYFHSNKNGWIKKTIERRIRRNRFIKEDFIFIKQRQILEFSIEEPKGKVGGEQS